tara:strand:- start:1296 stop:2057 length:762 start_codon:yes stop_codon:yes gene_type:complete
MKLCFSIVIYGGMTGYVTAALDKIDFLSNKYPSAQFIISMDSVTAKQCIGYFQHPNIHLKVYHVLGNIKSTVMFRFRPLFDAVYLDYDMIIIDVHDDHYKQIQCIESGLDRLYKTPQKDVYFMYVHSDDDECPYNASVHKRHTHRDAGFSIWKSNGEGRKEVINSNAFDLFLEELQTTFKKFEYGGDEVLMDVFLKDFKSITQRQILQKNKLPLSKCNCECLPAYDFSVPKISGAMRFHGIQHMYICSRYDED